MGLSEDEEFELLSLEREKNKQPSFQDKAEEYGQKALDFAKKAANDPLAQLGVNIASGDAPSALLAAKGIAQNPSEAVRSPTVQAGLPIAGGALGGFPGAAGGEAVRQMLGTAFAPETVPRTTLGRAASMLGAGVAQDPKVLNAIPGVPQVSEMVGNLASKAGAKAGGAMSKISQVFSGGKAQDFKETAKKGVSMYGAPSKQEAGAAMGAAIEKLPGESIKPTMAETIQNAVSPESSTGNAYLVDIGKRIDDGELITARQALKAKQSLDAVIDTVPIWQAKRRGALFDLKRTFDEVLSGQSGELKQASNDYRAAALKDNMTKFLPVNKHGEYSRLAGMLSTLGGSVGGSIGGHEGGAKGGLIGGLAPIAAAVALSPGSFGGAAALGGSGARAINSIAQNPAARQVLLQVLQRLTQNKQEAP